MVYIAFLRGVNVGGHNVKMAVLRSVFEELGLDNVRSYITSGNIFFETDSSDRVTLTDTIEAVLQEKVGYSVPIFLRSVEEIAAIIDQAPFQHYDLTPDRRFCVVFVRDLLATNLQFPVSSSKHDMELIATTTHEAFVVWHIINGRPPSGTFPTEVMPKNTTSRFYHTLIKILQAAQATT